MFDANGNPILVVIRQREEGRPYVVHHASKMLNDAKKILHNYSGVTCYCVCIW